jgi:hypothetical protein
MANLIQDKADQASAPVVDIARLRFTGKKTVSFTWIDLHA